MFTKIMIALSAAIIVGAASMAPAMAASSKVRLATAKQSFALATQTAGRRHSSIPVYDVYVHGRYAGSDPDPHVRTDLARNPRWSAEN